MLSKIQILLFCSLVFVSLVFPSCEKNGQLTTIEGFVRDSTDGAGVANVPMTIWVERNFFFSSGFTDNEANFQTDSTGFYSFAFFNRGGSDHEVQAVANDKFYCSSLEIIEIGEKNKIDLTVIPQVDLLELHFLNSFEQDSVTAVVEFSESCGPSYLGLSPYRKSLDLRQDSIMTLGVQPNSTVRLDILDENLNDFHFEPIEIDTSKVIVFIP